MSRAVSWLPRVPRGGSWGRVLQGVCIVSRSHFYSGDCSDRLSLRLVRRCS